MNLTTKEVSALSRAIDGHVASVTQRELPAGADLSRYRGYLEAMSFRLFFDGPADDDLFILRLIGCLPYTHPDYQDNSEELGAFLSALYKLNGGNFPAVRWADVIALISARMAR